MEQPRPPLRVVPYPGGPSAGRLSSRRSEALESDRLREIELGVGVSSFDTRARARAAIQPFLSTNRALHESFGPDHEGHADPASEFPRAWRDAVVNGIIPNSRRIQRIADANHGMLTDSEVQLVGQFAIHIDGLEARHVGGQLDAIVVRFPEGMENLFAD